MEKKQILGVTVLSAIAFAALGIGIFEKMSIKQAELSEKKRMEAARHPEPLLEAQPIPLTVEEMAAEMEGENTIEEEILMTEEAAEEDGINSDLQTINELTTTYDEGSF